MLKIFQFHLLWEDDPTQMYKKIPNQRLWFHEKPMFIHVGSWTAIKSYVLWWKPPKSWFSWAFPLWTIHLGDLYGNPPCDTATWQAGGPMCTWDLHPIRADNRGGTWKSWAQQVPRPCGLRKASPCIVSLTRWHHQLLLVYNLYSINYIIYIYTHIDD